MPSISGPGIACSPAAPEYASNYLALSHLASRTGARVEVVPDDEHGQFDVDALTAMLDERVRLVSLVHVPTQGGLVNPAARAGAVTRAAGVPLILDACQSVGQMPLGRRRAGLRRADRNKPQVPARSPRHGLSLRPPGPARTPAPAVH